MSAQDSADFQKQAQAATPVLQRALDLLEQREQELDQQEYSMGTFDDASWPYKQAAIVGARSELRNLKQLLSLRPQGLDTNGLTDQ
jgi:hypothetical protein